MPTMPSSSASSATSRSSHESERVGSTVGETMSMWFEVTSIPLIIDAPLDVVWRIVDEICEHPDSSPFNRVGEIEPTCVSPRRRSFIGQLRRQDSSPLKERPAVSSVDLIDTSDEHKREVRFNHRPRATTGELCNAKTIHLATRIEPEPIKVDKGKEKATSVEEGDEEAEKARTVRFVGEEAAKGKPKERTRYQVTEIFFHDRAIGYRQDMSPGLMEKTSRAWAQKVKKLAEEQAKSRATVPGSRL